MIASFYSETKRFFLWALLCTLASCGFFGNQDDSLKAPSSLYYTDEGGGDITLYWQGNNKEDAFEGYSVFGAKYDTIAKVLKKHSLKPGSTIPLLDKRGEPHKHAIALLEQMSYDPKLPFERRGATTKQSSMFKSFPISTETNLLYSCLPNETTSSACGWAQLKGKKGRKDKLTKKTHSFHGETFLNLTSLKPGQKYCFLVLASGQSGKQTSDVTSEMVCLVPKMRANLQLAEKSLPLTNSPQVIELSTLRTLCGFGQKHNCTERELKKPTASRSPKISHNHHRPRTFPPRNSAPRSGGGRSHLLMNFEAEKKPDVGAWVEERLQKPGKPHPAEQKPANTHPPDPDADVDGDKEEEEEEDPNKPVDPKLGVYLFKSHGSCVDQVPGTVCIEHFDGKSNYFITCAKDCQLLDLGKKPKGFKTPHPFLFPLIAEAQGNQKHYSLAGESVPLLEDHLYVIAEGATKRHGLPAQDFYYHLLFAKAADFKKGNIQLQMQLSSRLNML